MPFEKGKPKTGGRRPGSVNRFTGTFRDAVQTVYNGLGGHAAFGKWAKSNPTEYYRIASKLIPLEIKGGVKDQITVIVQRSAPQPSAVDQILDVLPDRNDEPNHDDAA